MNIKVGFKKVAVFALVAAWAWFMYLVGAALNESATANTHLAEIPKQFLLKEGEVVTKGSGWEDLVAYTAVDTLMRENLSKHLQEVRNNIAAGMQPSQRLLSYNGKVVKYDGNTAVVQAQYTIEEGADGVTSQVTNQSEFYLAKIGRHWFLTDVVTSNIPSNK